MAVMSGMKILTLCCKGQREQHDFKCPCSFNLVTNSYKAGLRGAPVLGSSVLNAYLVGSFVFTSKAKPP